MRFGRGGPGSRTPAQLIVNVPITAFTLHCVSDEAILSVWFVVGGVCLYSVSGMSNSIPPSICLSFCVSVPYTCSSS